MKSIQQIYTESALRNFSYLVLGKMQGASGKRECFCIDPFDGEDIYRRLEAQSLELIGIINTHEHYDHYCGNEYLVKKTGCDVYASAKASLLIPGVTKQLKAADRLELAGDEYLEVLETPGHTLAHISLLFYSQGRPRAVFSGDTFFNAGVGNCKNGGDVEILYQTISKIYQRFVDDIKVYPGHEYLANNLRFGLNQLANNAKAKELLAAADQQEQKLSKDCDQFIVTTMGIERQVNVFLQLDHQDLSKKLNIESGAEKEIFIALRKLRDQW